MKRTLILFLLIGWFYPATAQQPASRAFTLEQCIDYALQNSIAVKNATLDEEIAKARVKETIGIGLPQIDGSIGIQHNARLRRFFGQTPSGFIPPDTNPDLDSAPAGTVFGAQNPFQLKSAGDAGLNISQILFNGSYLVGLKASNTYKELSTKTAGQTREQTIANVSKAYYLAITNRERIKLFDVNIGRVDTLLRNTKALFQNGFAEKIDVDRVQVTYNNLVTEREKFKNIQIITAEVLKFQMNYPMAEEMEIVGSIEEFSAPDYEVMEDNWSYGKRWDYQLLQTSKRLQELDLKNKYAAGVPSLVAFANLGYSTGSANIAGVFRTESNIREINGIGSDKWYGYSLFGVTLNVPVFSGLQRTYRVQQSKLNLLKIENTQRQLESVIDLELKQVRITLENAIRTLQAQKANMDLAGNVARVTKIKYAQGVGSSLEVIDAEASLREAQINYYNALYDALVAKVDTDKAYGKLNPYTEK